MASLKKAYLDLEFQFLNEYSVVFLLLLGVLFKVA